MATWVVGYGIVQTLAPRFTGHQDDSQPAVFWGVLLALVPAGIAGGLSLGWSPHIMVVGGLLVFGILFAINSALHSYLIVSYARGDGVSLDVGFYYMSNAAGRLLGTVLSGWIFQKFGLEACLWISAGLVALAALFATALPTTRVRTTA
jgi:predicted MFS family arabinose efflux permease